MNTHEWVEDGTPATGTFLPSVPMTVCVFEVGEGKPFRDSYFEGGQRIYLEQKGRQLLRVNEGAAGSTMVWSCGCPVQGGPNFYNLECSGQQGRIFGLRAENSVLSSAHGMKHV